MTPLTTGRDNRRSPNGLPNILLSGQVSLAAAVPRSAFYAGMRALVCLRDGLTAGFARRTLPKLG